MGKPEISVTIEKQSGYKVDVEVAKWPFDWSIRINHPEGGGGGGGIDHMPPPKASEEQEPSAG